MPEEGDCLLFGAELAFVSHQSFLVQIAQAKVQKGATSSFSTLNAFPDQQIVWPVRKIGRKRGIELVIESVFPLQEKIASNDFPLIDGEEKESVLRFHEMAPDVLKKTVRLGQKPKLVLPYFQMHLK